MMYGEINKFAIESEIFQFLSKKSLRGIGFFVVYIANKRYGVKKRDATALACSYDAVCERIKNRNNHLSPFSKDVDIKKIIKAFRFAFYDVLDENEKKLDIDLNKVKEVVLKNNLILAPDGDEAFDDGSYILQFDYENEVRLIGFKSKAGGGYDENSLSDIILDSSYFYQVLSDWKINFEAEWLQKQP